jgi:phosphoenolpyruvate carboxykinase (GTP)
MGSIMSSERTAAATGEIGVARYDPFAMLPFCGYHMGDYFSHWLQIGARTSRENLPRIFYVNWFRKSSDGQWLWPGFGENSRVLKWIFERCDGADTARETPIGYVPRDGELDLSGFDIADEVMRELLHVDRISEHYAQFGDRLPDELQQELEELRVRLGSAVSDG